MTFKSLGRFRLRHRFSLFEATIAVFSPVLALVLRGVNLEVSWTVVPILVYCGASTIGGIIGLAYVNISKSPSGFVSTVDLIKTFKAALFAAVAGVIATFFATHMQYVPRYVPIIHFFMFSGLITALNVWRARISDQSTHTLTNSIAPTPVIETQLLLGCGPLSVHYAALMDELPQSSRKIAGIVSICGDLVGTSLGKRIVLGPIENFREIIAEFQNHGVDIDRIIIAASDPKFQNIALDHVSDYCDDNGIPISFLSDYFDGSPGGGKSGVVTDQAFISATSSTEKLFSRPNSYLSWRQRYDWIMAIILITGLSPLLFIIWLLTLLDVGRPAVFWQQRVGRDGKMITVHKFRTLPHRGSHPDEDQRTPSRLGLLLQKTRLDELPQLFDIVEGRLSFIGPRPLLPRDLPFDTGGRETILPGVTGWAQVHGGKLISAEEKIALDRWYLIHASPWLDVIILFKTLWVGWRRHERRDDHAIERALLEFGQVKARAALDGSHANQFSNPASPSGSLAENTMVRNPSAA